MLLDQFLHLQGGLQSAIPALLIKVGGRALLGPVSGRQRIVVKRYAIHTNPTVIEYGLQHLVCPVIILCIGTAGDLRDGSRIAVITNVGLISAVQIPVILRSHIASAAPVLVAHTKVVHSPGCFMSVCLSQVCHRRHALKGHVLHPLAHLLYGTAAQIAVDVGLAAHLSAQLHKLVGTEAVVFHDTAPVGVDHLLTGFLRSDAVLPVILIRKASAGPAKHGNLNLLQCLHHILAHTVLVGNVGVLSHKDSLVDTSSQMLGKMSLQLRVDVAALHIGIHIQFCHNSFLFSQFISLKNEILKFFLYISSLFYYS